MVIQNERERINEALNISQEQSTPVIPVPELNQQPVNEPFEGLE